MLGTGAEVDVLAGPAPGVADVADAEVDVGAGDAASEEPGVAVPGGNPVEQPASPRARTTTAKQVRADRKVT